MATPNPDIIYRSGSTGPLTFDQLDGNFALLSQSIANASSPFPFTGNAVFSGSILVSGSIIPNTNGVSTTSSFNLGSPTAAWKDIYVSNGTINFLDATGTIVQTMGTGNNQLTGNTTISGSLSQGTNNVAQGTSSHAEGRQTSASGDYSHAEGRTTRASGDYSHAEGLSTRASGSYSHAEGNSTISLGTYSHAEGLITIASGYASHAEGGYTLATGSYSHAEGASTTSSGDYSHAEGNNTISLGYSSHAEGLGTIAAADYQHVSGKYNVTSSNENDLFIVGNGTLDNARKNALVVKMSGSLTLPTTRSAAPSWTGVDGEIVPATVGGSHFLYMWMAGAWRSGSFA